MDDVILTLLVLLFVLYWLAVVIGVALGLLLNWGTALVVIAASGLWLLYYAVKLRRRHKDKNRAG